MSATYATRARAGARADDALLEACRQAPDDDAPRLVWADAVGGERGELVVIQCDLARGGLPPAEAAARRRRERELLARHGAAWAGLEAFHSRHQFRRGFVEAIELDARTFASYGEAIFRRAPLLRSLTARLTAGSDDASDGPLARLRLLLEAPAFWRLSGLDVAGAGVQASAYGYERGFDGRGDEAARALAASGAIAHLDALGISSSGLTAAGAHHLVASGELGHLEALWLRGHDLGADAILAVLARAPGLRSLDLYGATDLEAIAPALPPLAELHLSGTGDAALAALGASRAAPALERLRLTLGAIEDVGALRAFPRLRELDLRVSRFGDPARAGADLAAVDLAAALPALRRLQLSALTPAPALRAIARALGPQLEELALRGGAADGAVARELAAHVAGEVRGEGADSPEDAPPLL